MATTSQYQIHQFAKCCWCSSLLMKVGAFWWCQSEECRDKQRRYAIAFETDDGDFEWWHVPLPKQAHAEMQTAPNVMYAGAAGPGKSYWIRRRYIRRALAYENYRGLLVRKQLVELQATHLSYLPGELLQLEKRGIKYKLKPKYVEFPDRGSVIHFGHLSDKRALKSLLSTEYDDIGVDECSTINPDLLPELASRARTTNPAVISDGGAKFMPVTNFGGPATQYLVDHFIDHMPDFEKSPQMAATYRAEDWVYVEATLDDNPYLEADYADKRLAGLDSIRYQQLRYANYRLFDGMAFPQWEATRNGAPWHVQKVTLV